MKTSPLLSNVRYRVMITPVNRLLAMLIHICPSCWTICSSFESILEMGTVHWIGLKFNVLYQGWPNLLFVWAAYRKTQVTKSRNI